MRISALMHKLLIEKGMDGFSVTELRDASMLIRNDNIDSSEARKQVYRQILRFIKKDWLRYEGNGHKKKYYQTNLFRTLQFVPKLEMLEVNMLSSSSSYTVLHNERSQYKGELEVIRREIREYQSLNRRFPELQQNLSPLLEQAKDRSVHLHGKINVLENVLQTLSGTNAKY
ncbi:hypothetical protein AB6C60_07695 [Vibrio cyclitrophicus]